MEKSYFSISLTKLVWGEAQAFDALGVGSLRAISSTISFL